MEILDYERLLADRGMSKMNYLNCMTLVRVLRRQKKWGDVTHPIPSGDTSKKGQSGSKQRILSSCVDEMDQVYDF